MGAASLRRAKVFELTSRAPEPALPRLEPEEQALIDDLKETIERRLDTVREQLKAYSARVLADPIGAVELGHTFIRAAARHDLYLSAQEELDRVTSIRSLLVWLRGEVIDVLRENNIPAPTMHHVEYRRVKLQEATELYMAAEGGRV